jgi:hypothetical protein
MRSYLGWPENLLFAMGAYSRSKGGKKEFDKSLAIHTNLQMRRLNTLLDSAVEPDVKEYIYSYYRDMKSYAEIAEAAGIPTARVSYKVQKSVMYLRSMNGLEFVLDGTRCIFSRELFMSGLDKKILFALGRNRIYTINQLYKYVTSRKIYSCRHCGEDSIKRIIDVLIKNGYTSDKYDDIIDYYRNGGKEKEKYSTSKKK